MREHELEQAKEADYKEATDDVDDIEEVEETLAEKVMGENEEENQHSDMIIERAGDEESAVAATNEGDVRKETETNAFRMYVSKSAQKRARQKEKHVSSKTESKNSKSESYNAMKNKGSEEVMSKAKKEMKGNGIDKGKRVAVILTHILMCNIASWNIRGLNIPVKMLQIRDWINKN